MTGLSQFAPLRHAGVPNGLTDVWSRAVAAAAAPQRDGSRSQLIAGQLRYEPVPRIAPSGRSLAYVHDDWRGARRLRVIDPTTGAVLRSHRVNGQVSYDWRGDTLIVAQLDYTGRWTVRSDLWRWTPDGAWTQLTAGARVLEPRAGGGVSSSNLRPTAKAFASSTVARAPANGNMSLSVETTA